MSIRKCTSSEAHQAAINYGCRDEHELKKHVAGAYLPVSQCDIFIDENTREISIANKDGSHPQTIGVKL